MNRNSVVASLLLAASSFPALAGTLTVNDAGDTGPGNCASTCTLRDAIATAISGDTLVFAPGLASPITLSQGALVLNRALTIQGPGAAKLTVSANNATKVLIVSAQVSISGLTLADGYVLGTAGSNGINGTGTAGAGGTGGPGDVAGGACVQVANSGALVLDHVALRHCVAYAGSGGNGGSGAQGSGDPMNPSPGGPGGNGGPGGDAHGAAVLVYGSLSLLNSSIVDGQAHGGGAGNGGNGGSSPFPSTGGTGGTGGAANGGAIFAAAGASLRLTNCTITAGTGIGGNGGAGGTAVGPPAFGGAGGAARGGLIDVDAAATLADIEFSTLAGGQVAGGSGGASAFQPGQPGTPSGNAISAASTITALSSVVVDVQSGVSLCDGQVAAASGSVNLSEDTSCSGFTLHQTFAQLFHPLDVNTTPWPGYLPLYHSAVIDAAATCQDLAAQTVANDQHDTLRPQGAKCDLGAIEADYIFVGDFE